MESCQLGYELLSYSYTAARLSRYALKPSLSKLNRPGHSLPQFRGFPQQIPYSTLFPYMYSSVHAILFLPRAIVRWPRRQFRHRVCDNYEHLGFLLKCTSVVPTLPFTWMPLLNFEIELMGTRGRVWETMCILSYHFNGIGLSTL